MANGSHIITSSLLLLLLIHLSLLLLLQDKDNYGEDLETLMKTSRFVPDKEFSGTDRTSKRDGPVRKSESKRG